MCNYIYRYFSECRHQCSILVSFCDKARPTPSSDDREEGAEELQPAVTDEQHAQVHPPPKDEGGAASSAYSPPPSSSSSYPPFTRIGLGISSVQTPLASIIEDHPYSPIITPPAKETPFAFSPHAPKRYSLTALPDSESSSRTEASDPAMMVDGDVSDADTPERKSETDMAVVGGDHTAFTLPDEDGCGYQAAFTAIDRCGNLVVSVDSCRRMLTRISSFRPSFPSNSARQADVVDSDAATCFSIPDPITIEASDDGEMLEQLHAEVEALNKEVSAMRKSRVPVPKAWTGNTTAILGMAGRTTIKMAETRAPAISIVTGQTTIKTSETKSPAVLLQRQHEQDALQKHVSKTRQPNLKTVLPPRPDDFPALAEFQAVTQTPDAAATLARQPSYASAALAGWKQELERNIAVDKSKRFDIGVQKENSTPVTPTSTVLQMRETILPEVSAQPMANGLPKAKTQALSVSPVKARKALSVAVPRFAQPTESFTRRTGETARNDLQSANTGLATPLSPIRKGTKNFSPPENSHDAHDHHALARQGLPADWLKVNASSGPAKEPTSTAAGYQSRLPLTLGVSTPSPSSDEGIRPKERGACSAKSTPFPRTPPRDSPKKMATYMSPTKATTMRSIETLGHDSVPSSPLRERVAGSSPVEVQRTTPDKLAKASSPTGANSLLSPLLVGVANTTPRRRTSHADILRPIMARLDSHGLRKANTGSHQDGILVGPMPEPSAAKSPPGDCKFDSKQCRSPMREQLDNIARLGRQGVGIVTGREVMRDELRKRSEMSSDTDMTVINVGNAGKSEDDVRCVDSQVSASPEVRFLESALERATAPTSSPFCSSVKSGRSSLRATAREFTPQWTPKTAMQEIGLLSWQGLLDDNVEQMAAVPPEIVASLKKVQEWKRANSPNKKTERLFWANLGASTDTFVDQPKVTKVPEVATISSPVSDRTGSTASPSSDGSWTIGPQVPYSWGWHGGDGKEIRFRGDRAPAEINPNSGARDNGSPGMRKMPFGLRPTNRSTLTVQEAKSRASQGFKAHPYGPLQWAGFRQSPMVPCGDVTYLDVAEVMKVAPGLPAQCFDCMG